MAIDDNTSYELTGAQVKDLASKINAKADSSSLATVATSGLYSDLSGTPTIPTKTSDLTNDGADNTSTYVEADELATVATSGSYADLSNKPTIPAAQVNSDWDAVSGVAQILNKPTIPTVNDATLTITQNGTSAGTFTANASSNTTIALTDTTYSTMAGATSGTAGAAGLVPAPAAGDQDKVLKGDGTWGAAADTATVIYMVKTADSGTHDYTVVFYTELAHTNTVSYSTVNEYVTDGKSVLIIDGIKSSGSPLAAVTGSPKGSGPMNTVVDGALYKFSYSSGTTYLDIDSIIHAVDIEATTPVPAVETAMIADGAVTNAKIDWSNIVSSATTPTLTSLGNPAFVTSITNNSLVIGGRFLVVDVKCKISTNNSSYTQVAKFTLPHNINHEAVVSLTQEGVTNNFRYVYLESNGTLVVATNTAISGQTVRICGFVPLLGT